MTFKRGLLNAFHIHTYAFAQIRLEIAHEIIGALICIETWRAKSAQTRMSQRVNGLVGIVVAGEHRRVAVRVGLAFGARCRIYQLTCVLRGIVDDARFLLKFNTTFKYKSSSVKPRKIKNLRPHYTCTRH